MSASEEDLNQRLAQLKDLCTTLTSGGTSSPTKAASLLNSLAVSYDQALAVLNDLFSVLSREVATDSGLFSRDVWNKTLAEVCRRAIVNVEKTGGDEAAVKEEIRIIEKKEALLRTIIDAVAPR